MLRRNKGIIRRLLYLALIAVGTLFGPAQNGEPSSESTDTREAPTTNASEEQTKMTRTEIPEKIFSLEILSTSRAIAVSPDGKLLAIAVKSARRQRVGGDALLPTGFHILEEGSEIWLVDVESGERRNLTPNWGTSTYPTWSADGQKFAFYSDKNGKAQLWLWTKGDEAPRLVSEVILCLPADRELPALWTPDGERVVVKLQPTALPAAMPLKDRTVKTFDSQPEAGVDMETEFDRGISTRMQRYRADIGVVTIATGEVQTLARGIYPHRMHLTSDGTAVAVMNFQGVKGFKDTQISHEFTLLPLDGRPPKVFTESLNTAFRPEFSCSPDGHYIVYGTKNGELFIISTEDGHQTHLTTLPSSQPPLWSSDSQYLFCVSDGHLWRVVLADSTVEKLTAGFDWRVGKIVHSVTSQTVWAPAGAESIYIQTRRALPSGIRYYGFHRLNLRTRDITQLVAEEKVYSGGNRNLDVAPQTGEIFYSVEDAVHPPDVWIADTDFQNPRQLTHFNPEISTEPLATARLIEWKTPSGTSRRGTLLLPADAVEGPQYPIITWVYGGIDLSAWYNDFGSSPAAAGELFQLTRRGYGIFFPDTSHETYSPVEKITESVLSGIDTLIAMGIADATRLGVMGYSYGGYAVNALITQTPRFGAAVSVVPVCNLISLYGALTKDGNSSYVTLTEGGQGRMGGSLWEFPERYIENSPIFFLDKVETPLLLVAGELDVECSRQADEMFSGLRRLGKRTTLVRYPQEGHAHWSYPTLLDYWQRVIEWFDEHLAEPRMVQAEQKDEAERLSRSEIGLNVLLTPGQRTREVLNTFRAPGQGNQDYTLVVIDATRFENSGSLTIEVQVGGAGPAGSFDLFPGDVELPTQGRPEGVLASAYDVLPGSTGKIVYQFVKGQRFQLGVTGNWHSEKGSINAFRARISIKPE